MKVKSKLFRKPRNSDAKPEPSPPRVVVLVPGLIMPSLIFGLVYWDLKRSKYKPRVFNYHSCWCDIPENGRRLAEFLRGLDQQEVDIVAFSMGNVILRWAANHHDIPRLRRVVMLAPPNQGAFMADYLSGKLRALFPVIYGKGALQLRRGDKGLCQRAGAMPQGTEVGVIAGGKGSGNGFNKLIPGDNDMTVAVAETLLPGMRDFALVRAVHSGVAIMSRPRRLIVRFLESGRFREQKGHS